MNPIKLFSTIRPNLNRRGEHQWRFGLASKIVAVFVRRVGLSITAVKSPVTTNLSRLDESLALIFGGHAHSATLSRLRETLFVISPKSDALQSKSERFLMVSHSLPLP